MAENRILPRAIVAGAALVGLGETMWQTPTVSAVVPSNNTAELSRRNTVNHTQNILHAAVVFERTQSSKGPLAHVAVTEQQAEAMHLPPTNIQSAAEVAKDGKVQSIFALSEGNLFVSRLSADGQYYKRFQKTAIIDELTPNSTLAAAKDTLFINGVSATGNPSIFWSKNGETFYGIDFPEYTAINAIATVPGTDKLLLIGSGGQAGDLSQVVLTDLEGNRQLLSVGLSNAVGFSNIVKLDKDMYAVNAILAPDQTGDYTPQYATIAFNIHTTEPSKVYTQRAIPEVLGDIHLLNTAKGEITSAIATGSDSTQNYVEFDKNGQVVTKQALSAVHQTLEGYRQISQNDKINITHARRSGKMLIVATRIPQKDQVALVSIPLTANKHLHTNVSLIPDSGQVIGMDTVQYGEDGKFRGITVITENAGIVFQQYDSHGNFIGQVQELRRGLGTSIM